MHIQCLQVGEIGTNCYLVRDEASHEAAVIDPGGEAPAVLEALEGAEGRCILLSHGHYDHTGGAAELAKALARAEVYIHEKDFHGVGPVPFPLSHQLAGVTF